MNHITHITTGLVLAAATAFAQGPAAPGGAPQTRPAGSGLNMAAQQVIEGTIATVQIAYGVEYPSIVVNKVQIKVAPVWYLLENDFELKAGEAVRVTAAPSYTAGDAYLYAVEITKTASGSRIALRNSAGVPLWLGAARQGGNPQAPRSGGCDLDGASIATASGTIESVTAGLGIAHPTLVLKLNGALLTFVLGPERFLLDSDIELKPGAALTVKYAACLSCDDLIALELTDAAGHTVVLRSADGRACWNN